MNPVFYAKLIAENDERVSDCRAIIQPYGAERELDAIVPNGDLASAVRGGIPARPRGLRRGKQSDGEEEREGDQGLAIHGLTPFLEHVITSDCGVRTPDGQGGAIAA